MNKIRISVYFMLFMFVLFFVSFSSVSADKTDIVMNSFTVSTPSSFGINAVHPTSGGSPSLSAAAQTVRVFGNYEVSKIVAYMKVVGAPSAYVCRAAIYNSTGTYGVDAAPDSLLFTSSNTVSSLSADYTAKDFTFSDANLSSGTYFVVVYLVSGTGVDNSNCPTVYASYNAGGSPVDGSAFYYRSNAWSQSSTIDLDILLYCNIAGSVGLETVDYFTGSEGSQAISDIHPTSSGTLISALAQKFTITTDFSTNIHAVQFKLSTPIGSPDATYQAAIYSTDGTGEPVSLLEQCNASQLIKSVSHSPIQENWFTMFFDGDYTFTPDANYTLVVWCSSKTTLDVSNVNRFMVANVNGHDIYHYYQGSDWVDGTGKSLEFYVFGDEYVPPPTPTPSPVPTATPKQGTILTAVPNYYMIILVLFAVVAILAGLYMTMEREQANKGVAFLFVMVALIIFIVLIVGYLAG